MTKVEFADARPERGRSAAPGRKASPPDPTRMRDGDDALTLLRRAKLCELSAITTTGREAADLRRRAKLMREAARIDWEKELAGLEHAERKRSALRRAIRAIDAKNERKGC